MRLRFPAIERPAFSYLAAIVLSAAAQAARLPLHPATLLPYLTYVPFLIAAAALGGLCPGLLATMLCTAGSLYFAAAGVETAAALVLTGLLSSFCLENLARRNLMDRMFQASPAATALLGGPEFTFEMVNAAWLGLAQGEPTTGRSFAEFWPEAGSAVLPLLRRVRETQTVYSASGVVLRLHHPSAPVPEPRYFDVSCVPVAKPSGEVSVLVGAVDVTAHHVGAGHLRAACSELSAVYASAPMALMVVDQELRVEKLNDLATRFASHEIAGQTGFLPGETIGCMEARTSPHGCGSGAECPHCPLRRAVQDTLNTGRGHENLEFWLPVAVEGVRQPRCLLLSTARLSFDRGPKVLICAQDITSRKRTEQDFDRKVQLINLAHDGIVTADAHRQIHGWNRGAEEMYGWTEAEAAGLGIHRLLRTPAESLLEIDRALLRDGRWEGELRHTRKDGAAILVDSRQVLLRDSSSTVAGILEINRDITARHCAEAALQQTVSQLESALAEKTVLLKEIHHRVKNNLAVVASLLSMKVDQEGSEDARSALIESRRRVYSMALIHEHLYGSERLDRIDFAIYARQLIQDVASTCDGASGRILTQTDLASVQLGIEQAVPCALILNELVTNAFKYAFPNGRSGRILATFREASPESLELAVEDDGVGLPAGRLDQATSSLGFRIVRILARQLDGSVAQTSGPGTRIVLTFPAGAPTH